MGGRGWEFILHHKETSELPINSDQTSGKLRLILELIGIIFGFLGVEIMEISTQGKGVRFIHKNRLVIKLVESFAI